MLNSVRKLDKINDVEVVLEGNIQEVINNPIGWAEKQVEKFIIENQDKYFEDPDRYFSPHCDPHKRAKKLAQLLKWSGDLSGKQTICRIKFSSLHAEVNKNGRPVQEGVGVDKPNL